MHIHAYHGGRIQPERRRAAPLDGRDGYGYELALLTPATLMRLQADAGNRSVAALLGTTPRAAPTVQRCPGGCDCAHEPPDDHRAAAAGTPQARISLQRQGARPVSHLPPSGESEPAQPCPPTVRPSVNDSYIIAKRRVNRAIEHLAESVSSGVVDPHLRSLMHRHFQVSRSASTQARHVAMAQRLLRGYREIARGMVAGHAGVSCNGTECRGSGDVAYVRRGDPIRIFLCPALLDFNRLRSDPLDVASTWVHELSHEMLGARDHEYYRHTESTSLETATALTNADSWAHFAIHAG